AIMQSFAGDIFHHQKQCVAVFPNFEDFADIGMIEGGGGLCLAAQAFARVRIGCHVGPQELDGDLTIEPRVAGAIHDAHAALTNTGKDFIRTNRDPRASEGRASLSVKYAGSETTSKSVALSISSSIANTLSAISGSRAVAWTYCCR